MTQCASVRKKGSIDQCPLQAVFGHTLCGRHARCKQPTLWAHLHKGQTPAIVRIQALIRGWLVRTRLQLGGPGVLDRRNLANDDDLVTCEERVHPFQYFGFEQNGKTWWFTFSTLWKWCERSVQPVNPYTKIPIDTETLKRLHAFWSYQWRHMIPLPDEPTNYQERLASRANVICQVLSNYGFGIIEREVFTSLTKMDCMVMFRFLYDDTMFTIPDTNKDKLLILRYCLRVLRPPMIANELVVLQSIYVLMVLMLRLKDPYAFSFLVLSALYRI